MAWGIVVQRPVVEENVGGYDAPFEDLPARPAPELLAGQVPPGDAPRTLSVNVMTRPANIGRPTAIVWR
jgi:hypothetical protein